MKYDDDDLGINMPCNTTLIASRRLNDSSQIVYNHKLHISEVFNETIYSKSVLCSACSGYVHVRVGIARPK